jgi:Tol biopolymer transport system component
MQALLSSQASLAFGTPIWAADGSHLFLTRTGIEQGQRIRRIERLDIDSGASETVFNDVAPFDVSPDGRWLAVARAGNLGQSILLVDLSSGQERTLVQEREYDTISMPRFDPSSTRLLFTAAALIAQAPAAPPAERFATELFGLGTAFAHGLPQDVYATPLDGGKPSKVAALSADEPALASSPDGSQLAILTVDALSTMPAGGGRLTPLLTPGGYGTVDWTK